MSNYLDEVRRKRDNESKRQDEKKSREELIKATKESSTSVVAEVARQSARNRTRTQSVKVTNENLAKSEDIDKVIQELKETQLAALLGGQNKPSVILADSTDLGDTVANLGDKIITAIDAIKTDQSLIKVITGLASEFKAVCKAYESATKAQAKVIKEAVTNLEKELGSKEFSPEIKVETPPVRIQPIDNSELTQAIARVESAIKANKVDMPKIDFSKLQNDVKDVAKAINSLSFPVPNYVLPFKDPNTGKATQVMLTADGKVPVDAVFTGDITIDQVGIENIAGSKINPSTEEKQDEIITAIEAIPGGGGVQYTEGDTDVSITGTALVFEGAGNAIVAATGDATNGLDVDVTRSALPTGAATSANQSTIIGHVDGIESTLGTIDTDTGNIVTNTTDIPNVIGTDGSAGPSKAVSVAGTDGSGNLQEISTNTSGHINIADGGNTITVDGTVGVSGTVTVDGSGVTQPVSNAGLTELAAAINSNKVDVNIVSSDVATGGTSAADDSAFTVGTSSGTPSMGLFDDTTPDSVDEGDVGVLRMSGNRNLYTQIRDGGGTEQGAYVDADGQLLVFDDAVSTKLTDIETNTSTINDISGSTIADDDTFTAGSNRVMMTGAFYDDDTPDSVNEGDGGAVRMSANRSLYSQIRDAAGNERGANVNASNQLTVSVDNTPTISGTVTANAGTNLNTSALALESGGNLAAAVTALQIMDDWDETNRAAVNTISGQAGVQGGSGTVSNNTQRVVLATDVALPAGTNAIGKLAANSGVDIGDVDVTSVIPGTGATNLGKAEDSGHTSADTGVFALAVRQDAPNTAVSNTDADYTQISVSSTGAVRNAPMSEDFAALANGPQVKKYYTNAGAVTDGIIWSPAAGKRWYVTDIFINVSAAATVTLEDDLAAGDAAVWKAELAANSGWSHSFNTPLFSGEDAADLLITTTAGNVYVTVTGYEI